MYLPLRIYIIDSKSVCVYTSAAASEKFSDSAYIDRKAHTYSCFFTIRIQISYGYQIILSQRDNILAPRKGIRKVKFLKFNSLKKRRIFDLKKIILHHRKDIVYDFDVQKKVYIYMYIVTIYTRKRIHIFRIMLKMLF